MSLGGRPDSRAAPVWLHDADPLLGGTLLSRTAPIFVLLASIAVVAPSNVSAQEVGDRLRVTLSPADVILIGRVSELHVGQASGFTLTNDQGFNFRIDASNIKLLQRSNGTGTYMLNGLLIGASLGAIVPCMVGWAALGIWACWLIAFETLPITTVGGGLAGLGIGALKKRDLWETIRPVDGSVGVTPGLILSLRSYHDRSVPTMGIGVVLRF